MAHASATSRSRAGSAGVHRALLARGRACSSDKSSNEATGSSSGGGGGGGKIALLLPETKTARYETQDKPLFEAKVKELCSRLRGALQQRRPGRGQAAVAGRGGADQRGQGARARPGRLGVGRRHRQQGQAAERAGHRLRPADQGRADRRTTSRSTTSRSASCRARRWSTSSRPTANGRGKIVMINGSPTDNNAGLFKPGAHSVHRLERPDRRRPSTTRLTGARTRPRARWTRPSPTSARTGSSGVYAANDGTAGGAIAAMKGVGITPIPPITGQDAELAGIQRVLSGEQYMTVYKAVKPEAEGAADAGRGAASRARTRRAGWSTTRSTTARATSRR